MTRSWLSASLLCLQIVCSFVVAVSISASAQNATRPEVPEQIKAPANERVVLHAFASGSQIYTCSQGADSKYAWTLKAPDAELRDVSGGVIGSHYAGPTWKLKDGSEVSGKAAARVDSPDTGSIPWLLVQATGHAGNGALSPVTSIQRIRTHGGVAPATACGVDAQGKESKSAYTADYYFYAPEK